MKNLKFMIRSYKGLILAIAAALLFIYSAGAGESVVNDIANLDVDWTDVKNWGPPVLMILFGLVSSDADAHLPSWVNTLLDSKKPKDKK